LSIPWISSGKIIVLDSIPLSFKALAYCKYRDKHKAKHIYREKNAKQKHHIQQNNNNNNNNNNNIAFCPKQVGVG